VARNGYKGAEARDDTRVGNLAKHAWVLVCAIDRATTAIPKSVLADLDIKRILEDKHEKRQENGKNVTSFRAWPLWPSTWVGYELGGSAPHQRR